MVLVRAHVIKSHDWDNENIYVRAEVEISGKIRFKLNKIENFFIWFIAQDQTVIRVFLEII